MSGIENISLMFKTKLGDTLYVDIVSSKDTRKIIGERTSLEEILRSIEEDAKNKIMAIAG